MKFTKFRGIIQKITWKRQRHLVSGVMNYGLSPLKADPTRSIRSVLVTSIFVAKTKKAQVQCSDPVTDSSWDDGGEGIFALRLARLRAYQ